MTVDFKVNASDIIIRQANNGWIVFEVSPEGDEVEANVFEDNDYTAVGEVIQHVFEDHTQTKRSGGFVLDWYPEGWDHPEGRPARESQDNCAHNPEDCVIQDCPECITDY